MVFSSVDLPAPFGPMMATISPSLDRKVRALQDLVVAPVPGDDVPRSQQAHRRRPPIVMPRLGPGVSDLACRRNVPRNDWSSSA